MKKKLIYEIITGVLVLLFLYTGFSKILDFQNFEISMRFQHMPGWLTATLIHLLPSAETIVAGLLVSDKSCVAGLYAYFVMMGVFTIHVGAALLHLFPKAPCACGDIIKSLGWACILGLICYLRS